MKPIFTQTGPSTWSVQYPEPAKRPNAPRRNPARRDQRQRKRFLVEDGQYGFRASRKRYRTAKAAIQAAECFSRGEEPLPGSLTYRALAR